MPAKLSRTASHLGIKPIPILNVPTGREYVISDLNRLHQHHGHPLCASSEDLLNKDARHVYSINENSRPHHTPYATWNCRAGNAAVQGLGFQVRVRHLEVYLK